MEAATVQVYEVSKEHGRYIKSRAIKDKVVSKILRISDSLPEGGRLIIDFQNVELISRLLLIQMIKDLMAEARKRGKGLFRGRFIIVKDPNDDVLDLLEICLKVTHASLLTIFTDPREPNKVKEKILNLPHFLRETLKIVEKHGPINSSQLAKLLGPEEGKTARERLRQLYRRGVVQRKPGGTVDGETFFYYEKFHLRVN